MEFEKIYYRTLRRNKEKRLVFIKLIRIIKRYALNDIKLTHWLKGNESSNAWKRFYNKRAKFALWLKRYSNRL